MRFRSQTETIDRLLERMQAKYEESAVMPKDTRTEKEKEKIVIMDAAKWHGNIKLCPPPCETVWAERPLSEFLLLYYSARGQKDFYMQIQERFQEANANVTMLENESYASQNAAIPTEADLASYLFAHVVLQPEQLTLARIVAERRRSEAEKREARSGVENEKMILKKLNQMLSTGESRLTYGQTLELVTMGFRALDPSIFDDINTSYRPAELLADMARDNNADEVGRLLNEYLFSENLVSELLFSASGRGSEKVVETILAHKTHLWPPSDLKHQEINVNYQSDQGGLTPLIVASANGHARVVEMLLEEEEVKVNLADYDGSTPLYEASSRGHESVVKLLLAEPGIDVNPTVDGYGPLWSNYYTPLHAATINGHEKVVEMLLVNKTHIRSPIDVNQTDVRGRTALILASLHGHENIVEMLLAKKGIDINQVDRKGRTALIMANEMGHEEIIYMLKSYFPFKARAS